MARVFAIANQKGGVAKTTTTQTVGLALADLGERVLLVDLDPQACLTFALGLEPEACTPTLHDVLLERVKAGDAIIDAGRVQLLPANIDLAGSELHLLSKTGREHAVRRALDTVRGSYDTILIDCPPSLGVLTVNGLTASDEVLVPLQCEALGHRGVAQLLETITDVREFTNPRLQVRGVIATMFDPRGRHAARCSMTCGPASVSRCSNRRSPRRCASPKPRAGACRSSSMRRALPVRRRIVRSRICCTEGV